MKEAVSLVKGAVSLPKGAVSLSKGAVSLPKGAVSLVKEAVSLVKEAVSLAKEAEATFSPLEGQNRAKEVPTPSYGHPSTGGELSGKGINESAPRSIRNSTGSSTELNDRWTPLLLRGIFDM